MIRKKILYGLCMALLIPCTAAFCEPPVIIFGDSLSDAGMNTPNQDRGNNLWIKTQGKTGAPITSLDPETRTHPLWVNQLTHFRLPGNTLYPLRMMLMQQANPATHSINYAYASAETGNHFLNDISGKAFPPYVDQICKKPGQISANIACVPGVLKQIQMYLDAVGHKPAPDTLFIIWAGGNDILNNINKARAFLHSQGFKKLSAVLLQSLMGASKDGRPQIPHAVIPELSAPIDNLLEAKDKLIAAGIQPEQIYVLNLPDLSKTPAGMQLSGGNPAFLHAIQLMITGFNEMLALALTHHPFNDNNLPASHILSMYELLNKILDHPEKYQLTQLSGNCVADRKAPLCTGYVFFDNKHPTVKTGQIIAEWVADHLQKKSS